MSSDLIRMAREAGAPDWWLGIGIDGQQSGSALVWVGRLAASVAAAAAEVEREECAKVCDHYATALDGGDNHYLRSAECRQAAAKIRSRGQV
ncbi:hypothetical protein AVME950_02370 [Acidovorax sp. SUPP950]|uniref:hypothetical protein n=1 Tax=Acidovorax sp. SUPP950 TaxID=511901 RepID=UPI0023C4F8B0|nr:hypothetical protein [Acidovorax sp. SUPP950]GKS73692.1 hypothetical protein AVME950_02370 [Acidovorax sp. SUPP950]